MTLTAPMPLQLLTMPQLEIVGGHPLTGRSGWAAPKTRLWS